MLVCNSLREIIFQLQDSCLADCKFLLVKPQFCRTVLYVIIVILEIFAGHLSDRIKYFVSQNEILPALTDRPALFVKTVVTKKNETKKQKNSIQTHLIFYETQYFLT